MQTFIINIILDKCEVIVKGRKVVKKENQVTRKGNMQKKILNRFDKKKIVNQSERGFIDGCIN